MSHNPPHLSSDDHMSEEEDSMSEEEVDRYVALERRLNAKHQRIQGRFVANSAEVENLMEEKMDNLRERLAKVRKQKVNLNKEYDALQENYTKMSTILAEKEAARASQDTLIEELTNQAKRRESIMTKLKIECEKAQTVADQLRIELSKTKKKMPTPTAASATTAITTAITTTNSGNIIPNMPKGAKAAETPAAAASKCIDKLKQVIRYKNVELEKKQRIVDGLQKQLVELKALATPKAGRKERHIDMDV